MSSVGSLVVLFALSSRVRHFPVDGVLLLYTVIVMPAVKQAEKGTVQITCVGNPEMTSLNQPSLGVL